MNEIINAIRQFFDYFRLWVIVAPWEQTLRVRLGKYVVLLPPGIHWRFSIIDAVYCQSVRLRISSMGRSTVMSKDGHPISYAGCLGYSILDIKKLYSSLHHAEDTLRNLVRAEIASFIATHNSGDCKQVDIEFAVNKTVRFECYGLSEVRMYITEFMNVRTYRLVGDWGNGTEGAALNVEAATK